MKVTAKLPQRPETKTRLQQAFDAYVDDGNDRDEKSIYLEKLAQFLKDGANPNGEAEDGLPLSRAALFGKLEVIELLIQHGALLERRDGDGYDPLRSAISAHNSPAVVSLLLEKGCPARKSDMAALKKAAFLTPEKAQKLKAIFARHGIAQDDPGKIKRHSTQKEPRS